MTIQHDTDRHRFVMRIDGDEAYLDYQPVGPRLLDYQSTYVPHQLRGRGIATKIVRTALDYARDEGFRVRPSCWFVRNTIERYSEYADLREG